MSYQANDIDLELDQNDVQHIVTQRTHWSTRFLGVFCGVVAVTSCIVLLGGDAPSSIIQPQFVAAPRYNRPVFTSSSVFMAAADEEWNEKEFRKELQEKMEKSLEALGGTLNSLRAGQAMPSMLDRVKVDYYGVLTPLKDCARITAVQGSTLLVEPFEKSLLKEAEKGIINADLNLTPSSDGNVIRINIPPVTEDKRKELAKQAKSMGEDSKVAIRNIRRDNVDRVKKMEKDKVLSKDACANAVIDVDDITSKYMKKLETMVKEKEKDLLTL